MYPTTVYDLGHARLAELHRQAQRDALARAARRALRPRQPADPAPGRLAILADWARRLGRPRRPALDRPWFAPDPCACASCRVFVP